MSKLREYVPALRYGAKILSSEVLSSGNDFSNVWYVDGDNGSGNDVGDSPEHAVATIQQAVTNASADDTIYVRAKEMAAGSTDPSNYAETIIIPATHDRLKIIGYGTGPVQGALPQVKKGSGSTALLTIRACGVSILNMGFNGAGSTGGGILLDDDSSTKSAYGTVIMGCHFKNCVGSTATNAATGGAIMWSAAGNAWQVLIKGNRFYKNVGDIVLLGTSTSVPQDVVIDDNIFSGPAANVDCNLFLKGGGSGMNGVIIRRNSFTCFPAIGSGTNAKQLDLTGCVGVLEDNNFATSAKTFGAAGNNLVPTTVFMMNNYQEAAAAASGEIGRT